MLTVEEATQLINENLLALPIEHVPLDQAIGRVLAQTVSADRDLPPFHRVTMDGIAIRYRAWENGVRDFTIQATQAAGTPALSLKDEQHAIEVMTGAMLPENTDCIIPYEQVEIKKGIATIQSDGVNYFQNIHQQGSDARASEELLTPGIALSPAEVAVLASVGVSEVHVRALPRIALVSTGDELVDVTQKPLPHQIRRSNDRALRAALAQMNIPAASFHFIDERKAMERQLKEILDRFDVILLSGGVSKGKFDFVPEVLMSLGIQKIFHQISQRPGKPFWFGRSDRHRVFALPGNPVSTYMCFYRYVKPWLMKCLGLSVDKSQAILASDFIFKPDLTYFLQVKVKNENGVLKAYPISGGGSGDFANLREVDGFLELPRGQADFQAGKAFDYYAFRQ